MSDVPPPDSKLTTTKQRWAEQGRFLTGGPPVPERARLPPGQHLVRDWPVLDLGVHPNIDPARWSLRVFGAVRESVTWNWDAFRAQDQVQEVTDIHCVTTWSRYDNQWDGVSTRTVLDAVQPLDGASFVILHSHDGYTTNLPLADFAAPDAILAHCWNGKPLTAEHGGPVRLIVPHLYLWKSAKWLQRIEFVTGDKPGFWETRGYHERGDPWQEQRYDE
ncbi:sulfite oxidase-like oxidoreductase [Acidisphaera sp. L21]|uniref:sulfite oxidase-like oxidoreductase n=1 Tax=Acidisphaera sp. L21 TaxID=1641851 RepID=UPI00131DA1F7|nr:sulfite oxidase-like oxidoreductase [Acidisphaera sp. L21]